MGVSEHSQSVLAKLFKVSMRYRGNNICPDERMDEHGGRTVRKHNAFAHTVGWPTHKTNGLDTDKN